MTYNEICMRLAAAEIENNRGEAAMLICRFADITKAELFGMHDVDFDIPELSDAVNKRCDPAQPDRGGSDLTLGTGTALCSISVVRSPGTGAGGD